VRILIADDEPISRRTLEAALVRLGHEVVSVEDGAAALSVLGAAGAPRLAILDWMMPGADGLTVCRTLRQDPGPYTYVILLTARHLHADMVEALDAGADDFLTKPVDIVELRARLRSGERVIALQEDLLRTQDALKHQATHDRLTGLWNRGHVMDELTHELSRAKREHASLSVAMVDLDHFKQVNDSYGHAAGDAVLQQIGGRMKSVLRGSDAIGRYGGEEFLIVLPRAEMTGAREVAERVRAVVEARPVSWGSLELRVTVTVGVASTALVGFDAASIVQACDEALYRGKAAGRNRVEAAHAGTRESGGARQVVGSPPIPAAARE
jgi:two-component system cell cycle response regulator